jgi:hypothetical protein
MSTVFPPNTPPYDPAPARDPLTVNESGEVLVKDNKAWSKYFSLLTGRRASVIQYLLSQPVLLSGLAANLPNATLYPENSRYYSTDTHVDRINLFTVTGDPTTAVWTVIP